ncbi:MAG: 6-phosphofructokinase [Desulfitobacteriaceae bacterium]
MVEPIKKIAVLTSGGDAPGMNATIRAVVRKGIYHGLLVYGIQRGFDGLITGEIKEMNLGSVADIVHRGGTILRTARSVDMMTREGQNKAVEFLQAYGIDALVVIGGDGSFRGAQTLSAHGVKIVGIPGTIDNDIPGTDLTIGFDTAVNTVVDAVSKIRDTASSHERTFIVEVMGRHCGNIALQAGLACGAESILVPEVPFDFDEVIAKLRRGYLRGKHHSIIILAEGVGKAYKFGEEINARSGFETRVTILGHLQRGGNPSAFDGMLAAVMGSKAVEIILTGQTDMMTAFQNQEVVACPLEVAYGPRRPFNMALYALAEQLAI